MVESMKHLFKSCSFYMRIIKRNRIEQRITKKKIN